jgi:hypothetical protein
MRSNEPQMQSVPFESSILRAVFSGGAVAAAPVGEVDCNFHVQGFNANKVKNR